MHRAPARIVPAEYETLRAAAANLDRGCGTVWAADARRVCGGGRAIHRKLTETGTIGLRRDGDDYREAAPGEDPDASILFGPGPIGGFVSCSLDQGHSEPGPPSAPEVARAFRVADRPLGTDFGDLEAARNVRQ